VSWEYLMIVFLGFCVLGLVSQQLKQEKRIKKLEQRHDDLTYTVASIVATGLNALLPDADFFAGANESDELEVQVHNEEALQGLFTMPSEQLEEFKRLIFSLIQRGITVSDVILDQSHKARNR
jgi:hypothetical protein